MTSRSRAGMTLTELMLVVVVVGVLAAAVVPRLATGMQATTAQSAASVVGADVEAAFSTAARSRRPVVLTCDCPNRTYQVADQTGGTVRMQRRLDKASDTGVDRLSFSAASVVIGPNGIASEPFEIDLVVGGSQRRVAVSRTGQVRIVR
ncbi:MAG: hypothetical protein H6Q77_623 [Gemmatimonadetes bacterium]|nr:hypothetical protein [Gemmatimonadota bacterium]